MQLNQLTLKTNISFVVSSPKGRPDTAVITEMKEPVLKEIMDSIKELKDYGIKNLIYDTRDTLYSRMECVGAIQGSSIHNKMQRRYIGISPKEIDEGGIYWKESIAPINYSTLDEALESLM